MDPFETRVSLSQDILQYLLEQEQFLCGEDLHPCDSGMGLTRVQSILEDVIKNVTDRAQYIEDYQARLLAHNQFPLFDFSTIIPNFFIDDEIYQKLSFRETLVVSYLPNKTNSMVPKPVGGLCQDVQLAKGKNPLMRKGPGLEQQIVEMITRRMNIKNNPPVILTESEQQLADYTTSITPTYERNNTKFLVHLSSKFNAQEHIAGSRITAWVDRNFHTLEEKRTEFVMNNGSSNEKSLYCALQPRRYYIKHKSSMEGIDDRKYYSMQKTRDLLCEGANIILMRYLAISRYIGTFELSTMYINGDMCRNIYECTGPESGIINEEKLDLCKIYRTIMEECGIIHKCVTILTLSGQLVKQEWNDCDYILQVNPLARISNDKPVGNESLVLSKIWEKDMQLFSNYLDFKTTCFKQLQSYLLDHPEFKNMMSDYVQSTLLMKPEEIVDYTIKHFKSYCPKETARPVYQSEEAAEDEEEGRLMI